MADEKAIDFEKYSLLIEREVGLLIAIEILCERYKISGEETRELLEYFTNEKILMVLDPDKDSPPDVDEFINQAYEKIKGRPGIEKVFSLSMSLAKAVMNRVSPIIFLGNKNVSIIIKVTPMPKKQAMA